MAEVKIEGLEELVEALKDLPDEIRKEVLTEAVDAAAEIIKAEAVRLVPKGKTGDLGASIAVREAKPRAGEDIRRVIGPKGVYYAGFQEYGTKKMSPHPYMRPAHDGRKEQAIQSARQDILEGIEELADKE